MRALLLTAMIGVSTASPSAAQRITSAVLVDADVSVDAGATMAASVGEVLARAGDALVPHRVVEERGAARRTTNVTFRLLRLAYFDVPRERLLLVVNHELFGHGARVRERFDGPIRYRIGVPPPYGNGGGATTVILDREASLHERLAIHSAGMEASAVAADRLVSRAVNGGRFTPHDALRYLEFELDTISYVLGTNHTGEEPGHDVADYLRVYNELATTRGTSRVQPRTLRREAYAGFANPMLAYAAWGLARYVATGSTDVGVPTLNVGGVRYLPMVRYRLAPFGREWSLVNDIGGRVRPLQVELRIGRAPVGTPWALGIRRRDLARWNRWTLHGSLELWRQPRLILTTGDVAPADAAVGAQLRGRVEREAFPVWFSPAAATLVVDFGIKSAGFVPGEVLRSGVVVRAGVGLPLSP